MAHATAAEVARPGRSPAVTLHRHWSTPRPVRPQDECTGCRSDWLAQESVSGLPPGSLPGQYLRGVQLAVQRAASGDSDAADGEMPGVALDVLSRSGHPLDAGTQAHLSAQLGHSFANVRVHDGSEAAAASASVGALAYTVGSSMVFGRGQYQPGTAAGRRLIAHEAAHVVQQRSGRVASVSAPTVGAADSVLEREADRVADAVVAGRPPSYGGAATSVAGAPGRAGPVHPVKHPGELAPDHTLDRGAWSPSAAADGPGVVQRVEDESAPIGELSAGEPVAQAGGPVAAEEQAASGTVEDANLGLTAQRQVTAPSGPIVVQQLSREEEINLSLTSPGRAVLDPSRPSLSLYNFGIDRSQLKAFHIALLAEFSAFLRLEVPAPTRIQVVGHADPTGTGPHNQTLSGQRAEAVATVLVAQGSAVQTSAEGDSQPVTPNTTADGRSRNRRVDILVTAAGPPQRPPEPGDPSRNFCDLYPLLCSVSPPGLPFPPWPLLCILVPEFCLAIPCMINPAMCTPPPPPPPPTEPPKPPDQPGGYPLVVFGPVRSANTPAAMGDRIPDQGATPVWAAVTGLDPATGPITVRVAGAPGPHGDAQVNGGPTATITGTTVLAVSGASQTTERSGGFHLALEAVHGGNVVARSAPFAVAAIMFDMHTSTARVINDATGVSLLALMAKQSDGSAGIASLDWVEYQEHLLLVNESGGMAGAGLGSHGNLILANIDQEDQHGTNIRHMQRPGAQTLHQTHAVIDHRTGAQDIPVTNSGFSVVREVSPDADRPGCLLFTIVKTGQAAIADGIASGAGSGVASASIPLPCPPGPGPGPGPGPATDPATPTIPVPYSGPMPRGTTPIFYQGGVSATATVGSFVELRFSFQINGRHYYTMVPCTVTSTTSTGIELQSLNPMPVNVAPLGSPQPIVMPARTRMTVPRSLL